MNAGGEPVTWDNGLLHPVPSPPAPARRPAAYRGASREGAAAGAARPVVLLLWGQRHLERRRSQHFLSPRVLVGACVGAGGEGARAALLWAPVGAPVKCLWVRMGARVGGDGEGARVSAIVRVGEPVCG